jgi:hypothetical protein
MKTLHPFARQLALADGRKCGMKTRSRGQNSMAVVGLEAVLCCSLATARAAPMALEAARHPSCCRLKIIHHGLGRMLTDLRRYRPDRRQSNLGNRRCCNRGSAMDCPNGQANYDWFTGVCAVSFASK